MTAISLQAETREKGKKDFSSNEQKKIPAVVYGPKVENQNIFINYRDFERVLRDAGESTLVDLAIGGKDPVKVLIHDMQKDPLNGECIHVDFYELDMSKKTRVDVELKFLGAEEVMKLTGGEISESVDHLEVECLPKDLVKEIDIDLSTLKSIGDVIYAKDIKLPAGLELISDPELPVASLQAIVEEKIEETAPAAEGEAPAPMTEREAKAAEATESEEGTES
ncbi:50S ribosomal protein L25 [Candidatus Kuenenbacteria bacterium]|nr:50S ribosomal protein L25 [Candidatus Kuenenbacteria bacterium]